MSIPPFPFANLEQAICWSPLTVEPTTPITDVLQKMNRAHANCLLATAEAQTFEAQTLTVSCAEEQASCVLVVEQGQLVGIFTERDVVRYVARGEVGELPIAQVMTPNPIMVARSQLTDIFELLQLLRSHQIRHLPITPDIAQPEQWGLMTSTSIRQVLRPEVLLRSRTVAEVMTADVIQAPPQTTVLALTRLMAEHRISCIVISEANRAIGIVTERDLVQFQSLGLDTARVLAAQIMSQPVFQLLAPTPLWEAHQQMQTKRIRRLVVADAAGQLQGLVTQTDILRTLDPWEMYATVNQLQNQVCSLEQERLLLLQAQNARLEAQVQARTAEIQILNTELEQRVAQRTAQLAEVNQQLAAEVAERTLLTQKLHQSEAKLRGLFNGMSDVILTVDRTGQQLEIAPTHPEQDYPEAYDVLQRTIDQFLGNAGNPAFLAQIEQCLTQQQTVDFTYPLTCGDDAKLWFAAKITPLAADWVLWVARDITAQKQIQTDLEHLQYTLEDRVKQRTQELAESNIALEQQICERIGAEQELTKERNLVSAIVRAAGALILVFDPQGRILRFNQTCETVTGYQFHEVFGHFVWELFLPPGAIAPVQATFAALRQDQLPQQYEGIWLTKNRQPRTIAWSYTVLVNDLGATEYIIGTGIDFTARKQAELARQQAEDSLRQLNEQLEQRVADRTAQLSQQLAAMDAAVDGIGLLQGDRYTYLNPAHLALFGYRDPAQLLGKSWRELYSPAVIAYFEDEVFPLVHQQRSWCGEVIAQRQDGTTFDQAVSLTLMDADTLICVCQDVSDRKRTEAQMRQALARERELNELKSRFIAMTSHEFRTPLAVIASSAGILKTFRDRLSPEKTTKHLNTIQTYVKHTTQLLDDILTINQAEMGKLHFEPEPLDLQAFCAQVLQEMQLNSPEHQLRFESHYPETLQLQADPKLLRQILINLLSNAVKYSPQGGEVNVCLQTQATTITLAVQDHGIGIPLEDQAHLFDSFHRATNVGTIQGTGLGLSITKKCVEIQGGSLTFKSVPQRGTTFTVILPKVCLMSG